MGCPSRRDSVANAGAFALLALATVAEGVGHGTMAIPGELRHVEHVLALAAVRGGPLAALLARLVRRRVVDP